MMFSASTSKDDDDETYEDLLWSKSNEDEDEDSFSCNNSDIDTIGDSTFREFVEGENVVKSTIPFFYEQSFSSSISGDDDDTTSHHLDSTTIRTKYDVMIEEEKTKSETKETTVPSFQLDSNLSENTSTTTLDDDDDTNYSNWDYYADETASTKVFLSGITISNNDDEQKSTTTTDKTTTIKKHRNRSTLEPIWEYLFPITSIVSKEKEERLPHVAVVKSEDDFSINETVAASAASVADVDNNYTEVNIEDEPPPMEMKEEQEEQQHVQYNEEDKEEGPSMEMEQEQDDVQQRQLSQRSHSLRPATTTMQVDEQSSCQVSQNGRSITLEEFQETAMESGGCQMNVGIGNADNDNIAMKDEGTHLIEDIRNSLPSQQRQESFTSLSTAIESKDIVDVATTIERQSLLLPFDTIEEDVAIEEGQELMMTNTDKIIILLDGEEVAAEEGENATDKDDNQEKSSNDNFASSLGLCQVVIQQCSANEETKNSSTINKLGDETKHSMTSRSRSNSTTVSIEQIEQHEQTETLEIDVPEPVATTTAISKSRTIDESLFRQDNNNNNCNKEHKSGATKSGTVIRRIATFLPFSRGRTNNRNIAVKNTKSVNSDRRSRAKPKIKILSGIKTETDDKLPHHTTNINPSSNMKTAATLNNEEVESSSRKEVRLSEVSTQSVGKYRQLVKQQLRDGSTSVNDKQILRESRDPSPQRRSDDVPITRNTGSRSHRRRQQASDEKDRNRDGRVSNPTTKSQRTELVNKDRAQQTPKKQAKNIQTPKAKSIRQKSPSRKESGLSAIEKKKTTGKKPASKGLLRRVNSAKAPRNEKKNVRNGASKKRIDRSKPSTKRRPKSKFENHTEYRVEILSDFKWDVQYDLD